MAELFEFQWGDEGPSLESAVFQALGAASTCWESLSGTGVFDSTRAKEIGDKLLQYIRDTQQQKLPSTEGTRAL